MNPRNETTVLEHDLRRILEVYRDGTSPSDAERARLWSRLGTSGTVAAGATATAFRVLVGGALIGVLAAVAVAVVDPPFTDERATTRVEAPPRASVEPAVVPAPAPAPAALPRIVASPREGTVATPLARRGRIVVSPPAKSAPTLAEELALLEQARIALGHGRPEEALASLAEHERSFAHGVLAEERRALRIIALCEAGKAAQGRGEARGFLAAHPTAALAGRIRTACAIEG